MLNVFANGLAEAFAQARLGNKNGKHSAKPTQLVQPMTDIVNTPIPIICTGALQTSWIFKTWLVRKPTSTALMLIILADGCAARAAGESFRLFVKMALRSMHSIHAACTRHTWSLARSKRVARKVAATSAHARGMLFGVWRKRCRMRGAPSEAVKLAICGTRDEVSQLRIQR